MALPLVAAPAIMIVTELLGNAAGVRSEDASKAGFLLGWIWATVFAGRMFSFAMKRHGDGSGNGAVVLLAAPLWGLIIAVASLALVALLFPILR
jgi:hypothetical protein